MDAEEIQELSRKYVSYLLAVLIFGMVVAMAVWTAYTMIVGV